MKINRSKTEAGRCQTLFRESDRRTADRIGGGSLPLSAATILQYAEELLPVFASLVLPYRLIPCPMGYPLLRRPDGQTVALHRRRRHSQTRGVINGRIEYAHSFRQLLAKFAGGVLTLSSGLSMGREGPSVQMGSYIGDLVSKWGHILSGERKQLLAAGAGAGLAAAFAAPLAAATLVIESIERFDAPKTAITTILAGCRRRSDRQYDFPDQPVPRHTGHRARPVDGTAYQAVYPVCRHRIGFRQTLFTADAIRQTDVPGHPATRIYQAVRSSGHGIHHFADGH